MVPVAVLAGGLESEAIHNKIMIRLMLDIRSKGGGGSGQQRCGGESRWQRCEEGASAGLSTLL